MLKRLWNWIFGINWTIGLGDGPSRNHEDDWECGPQGAGYLPLDLDHNEPE